MLQQPDQMTEAATTTTDKNGDVTNDQAAVLDSDDDLLDLDL